MYFYYQLTQTGKWSPTLSADQPSAKKPEGVQARKTRQVILLDPSERNLTLNELAEIHPLQ